MNKTRKLSSSTRLLLLTFAAMLLFASAAMAESPLHPIEGVLERQGLPFKETYPDNAPIPGQSITTGLPFSGDYLPVIIVVDNAPAAHPHWGMLEADVMYQVPNAGGGATKLMALYADHAPEMAGGVRSARTPFVDVAYSWGAAFAYAGSPGTGVVTRADVPGLMRELGIRRTELDFDLLANNTVSRRINWNVPPHNLSANIAAIQERLRAQQVVFPARGFRFRDDLPANGVPAVYLTITHHGTSAKTRSNSASASSFEYDAQTNTYARTNSSGLYVDRSAPGQAVPFSNVIVLRTPFTPLDGGYVATLKTSGTGAADIFTGGRYIAGGWFRQAQDGRTVFVDEDGGEIALQRGRTFIVYTNEVSKVQYR